MNALQCLLHEAIQLELRQVQHLAMLACMAPDECTRHIILGMLKEEAGEAMFWNTVDAAYRGVQLTAGEPCPTMPPVTSPTTGWSPTPGCGPCPATPGCGPFPGTPGCGPFPGAPSCGPFPGAPVSGPFPGTPGCGPCQGTPCPGMPTGGATGGLTGGVTGGLGDFPAWNPSPITSPISGGGGVSGGYGPGDCDHGDHGHGDCGHGGHGGHHGDCGPGFYSEEAKKDEEK